MCSRPNLRVCWSRRWTTARPTLWPASTRPTISPSISARVIARSPRRSEASLAVEFADHLELHAREKDYSLTGPTAVAFTSDGICGRAVRDPGGDDRAAGGTRPPGGPAGPAAAGASAAFWWLRGSSAPTPSSGGRGSDGRQRTQSIPAGGHATLGLARQTLLMRRMDPMCRSSRRAGWSWDAPATQTSVWTIPTSPGGTQSSIGRPGRLFVKDLGSTNGTLLNGRPIASAALDDGDVLTLGGCTVVVETDRVMGRPRKEWAGMVNLVLLAGKILFLLFLYLFIYWVIRASARDMRTSAAQARSAGRTRRDDAGPVTSPAVRRLATPAARARGAGAAPGRRGRSSGGRGRSWWNESPHARGVGVRHTSWGADARGAGGGRRHPSAGHLRLFSPCPRRGRSDGLLVEDLGSTNGTFVNGEEIAGAVVTGPETVVIGDSVSGWRATLMRLLAGARATSGWSGRQNEDSFVVGGGLFAVCDGMGGARAGEVASEAACRALIRLPEAGAVDPRALERAVARGQRRHRGQGSPRPRSARHGHDHDRRRGDAGGLRSSTWAIRVRTTYGTGR